MEDFDSITSCKQLIDNIKASEQNDELRCVTLRHVADRVLAELYGIHGKSSIPEVRKIVDLAQSTERYLSDRADDIQCPECSGYQVSIKMEEEDVPFMIDTTSRKTAVVKATVAVHSCQGCGQKWTNSVADTVRQEAVDRMREWT